MKTVISFLIAMTVLTTSCSKSGVDDSSVLTSRPGEDNPNGGGGNNIAASAVPAAVMSVFNSRYPDASQTQWKLLSDGTYKAEFFRGASKWQVIFKADGTIIKEEHL